MVSMNRYRKLFLPVMVFIISLLACSLPGKVVDDPFANVIPDLTGTAFFAALLTPSPTQQPASTATLSVEPTRTTVPSERPATITQTAIPTLTDTKARNGPLVQALYFFIPPVIDGNLEDWNAPSYPANNVVYGATLWNNSSDLSASVQVGWDDINLYLAAMITDDVYVQVASGENIFKGDSLELLMDTNLQGDLYVASLSPDDFQLGLTAGSPKPGQAMEAYLWFPTSLTGKRNQIRINAVQTTSGYQVEASIPWIVFEITPQSGMKMGFTFSVSDNDSPGLTVQQSMVSTVPGRHLTDPTTWGDLVIIK